MHLIHSVAELRTALNGQRETAFVPTMGNLHSGHISLIELARGKGRPVVASIFVNPLQFGAGEDFSRYPRTLDADCARLRAAGCDIVFAPDAREMYPEPQTYSMQPPLADQLCGAYRPGHFQGVATVVLKLFNLVQPRYAAFGKKDYQQLFILKGLVRQFNLPIEMLEGETGRAEDGLALSSRNGYLSPEERAEAPRLYRVLRAAAQRIESGETDFTTIEQAAAEELTRNGWRVDYVSARGQATLLPPQANETDLVVLAAAHLGRTRLIDNIECRLG
ncbi:MAG: pantoate--beta-alanine ligase [Hydrogenophilales bacterium 28-61-23]|nr:MAG: pantoate--beta-alanine ligase [Hydrogenophilales bacterium 28-61-23]